MIYCDNDYKLDCENKIQYSQLKKYDKAQHNTPIDLSIYLDLSLCDTIYYELKNNYYIFIVNVISNSVNKFYIKNVEHCIDITPTLFKFFISVPNKTKRTYKKKTV